MKPLTRSEWDRLEPELRQRLGGGTWGRILTTIEAGGFAPQPVTAADVREWIRGENDLDPSSIIGPQDFGRAYWILREEAPQVFMKADGRTVIEIGRDFGRRQYVCRFPNEAHVTLAVLAYAHTHPGVDVSHLLLTDDRR